MEQRTVINRFALRKQADKRNRYFDYNILIILGFLIVFGLVMVYSSSSYESYLNFGDSTYYFKKQLNATVLGVAAMILIACVPYHLWEKVGIFAYAFGIFMIFLIIPYGYEANGAKRWIRIFGFSIQPAEIAKVCVIIFLAGLITKMGKNVSTVAGFTIVMAAALLISVLLWVVTSNASSAIIVAGIAVIMLFVSTRGYRNYMFAAVGVGLLAVIVVWVIVANARSADAAAIGGYRGARILAWLDPEAYASGKGFQTLQSLYAIGSGGWFGKGIGESMQKLGFIPEAQNDMIFSVLCEELGFFGALTLMILFVLLIWRLKIMADNAKDQFGALLVIGVMGHIAIQVILNIAVVTNTIPNTGISLPFISYGGSAVVMLMIELGLCFGVQRGITLRDL